MKKLGFFAAFIILGSFLLIQKVDAAVLAKKYDRSYGVKEDYVEVKETKTLSVIQPSWYIPAGSEETFIIFNPVENDPHQKEKLDKTLSSIKLTDSSGGTLNFTSETTGKSNLLIKMRIPRNVNFREDYRIELNYNSYGLLVKSGAIRDLYIPAFAQDYKFETDNVAETITTTAKIPTAFGAINFITPQVPYQKIGDEWVAEFPQEKLVGETGWLQIGTQQYFSFKITQPYTKSTAIPFTFNTYKVIIPRTLKSGYIIQDVRYTNLTPEPYSIEQDGDGNLIANFKVASNHEGEIVIEGFGILTENHDLDFTQSGNLNDIPKAIRERNTSPAKYWESSSIEIQQVANELKGDTTNVYELISNTYKYVIDKIDYSDVKRFGINNRQGALETLRGGAAVCMEYSDLFIALMRAQGVPARGAFGYGYSALDYTSLSDSTINHQWAEVYLPKLDLWIPVDTTWGENGPQLIGGDLNHFYSHIASVDPDTPSTTEVFFYGSVSSLPERIMAVEVVEAADLDLNSGLSVEELLQTYPKKEGVDDVVSTAVSSVKLMGANVNNVLDRLILALLPDAQQQTLTVIKLTGLLTLVLLCVYALYRRRKRNFLH